MLAMNDALDDGKLQLVLTLLSKTSDDAVIQRKNEKGQNLMHILAMNSKRCGTNSTVFDNMMRICHILRKRGVNCLEQDNLGNNALHYAVQNDSQ
jgi:ankyrin repeat protein